MFQPGLKWSLNAKFRLVFLYCLSCNLINCVAMHLPIINLLCTCLSNKLCYYANTCLVQIAEQRHCFPWVVDVALMLGSVLGLWEGEVTFVTPFLEPAWLPAWGPHHRPVRSMTVPHSLTKPVGLMWMWGSLSGQWEEEVTLSHPPGNGGAAGIHVIYLSYILY